MNVAQSSAKLLFSRIVSAPVTFLGLAFFARKLGPHSMGIYFLFLTLTTVLSLVADFGIRGAVEKRISQGAAAANVLATGLLIKLVSVSVIVLAVTAIRDPINQYVGAEVALFVIFGVCIREFGALMLAVLRGELRVGETAALEAARSILMTVVGGLLVTLGFGIRGIIYGFFVGWVTIGALAFIKCTTTFARPSVPYARSLLTYSRYNWISSAGGFIYNWSDIAVIGFILGPFAVGAYEYAWRASMLVMFIPRSISKTMFPHVSRWNARNEKERIKSAITRAISAGLFISIPALFGTILFGEAILRFIFGGEFTVATVALIVLMGEKIIQSIYTIVGQSLEGVDEIDHAARATALSAVANVLLNFILVSTIGITGAAIGTAIAVGINTAFHLRYLSRMNLLKVPHRFIGWYLLGSACMFGIIVVFRHLYPVTSAVRLAEGVIVGLIAYLTFAVLVPEVRDHIVIPGLKEFT